MPAITKSAVKRGLTAHGAIGLLASGLLYLICVTGTLAVFYQELQRAEQPNAPEMSRMAPGPLQAGVDAVLGSEPAGTALTHLYVQLPEKALPRTAILTDEKAVLVAPDGSVAGPLRRGWSDFLIDLHYTLHLPSTIGLIVVGAFGVAMVALSITGVIAHPRIFRDAFRLRSRQRGGVALADWHNRLSVWTLPFSIGIALTGAVIGLGGLTTYGLAKQFYGGDRLAPYAPIFGDEPAPDAAPADMPDVATPMRYMATHYPKARPYYLIVDTPLTKGQHVQILARRDHRLIYGESYNFDGEGHFVGTGGLSDGPMGRQAAASNYGLHFGNFGGLPVKLAYLLFGAALCAIIGTGPVIWLGKRRRRGIDDRILSAAWNAVLWSVPAMLIVTFAARFVMGDDTPFAAIYWIGLAAWIAVAPIWAARPGLRGRA